MRQPKLFEHIRLDVRQAKGASVLNIDSDAFYARITAAKTIEPEALGM